MLDVNRLAAGRGRALSPFKGLAICSLHSLTRSPRIGCPSEEALDPAASPHQLLGALTQRTDSNLREPVIWETTKDSLGRSDAVRDLVVVVTPLVALPNPLGVEATGFCGSNRKIIHHVSTLQV